MSFDIIHWYDEAIHKIRNKGGQYTSEKVLHHQQSENCKWEIILDYLDKV